MSHLALLLTLACATGDAPTISPPPPPPSSPPPAAPPPAGTPIAMTVAPAGRKVAVPQGGIAPDDNAAITITGDGAASATWAATSTQSWLSLTIARGTGSSSLAWIRNAGGLAPGIYVDTITVAAAGVTSAHVVDTLQIMANPVALTLSLSPQSRSAALVAGANAPDANVAITISGDGAASTPWTATHRQSWTALVAPTGIGSGSLTWHRQVSTLPAGTYVDTITISAPLVAGGSRSVLDSIVIAAAPVPLSLSINPGSHTTSLTAGGAVAPGTTAVTISGTGSSTATWSVTHRQNWNTLAAAGGAGNGVVSWTRGVSTLAAGAYVDTITVLLAGAIGSPARFLDSVIVAAPPPAPPTLQLSVSPASRKITLVQGSAAVGASATVTLTGANASVAAWTAAKRKAWTTLTNGSGAGSGTIAWTRSTTGLGSGTYVDTISITAAGATGSPSRVIDSLIITPAAPPPPPPGSPDLGLNADLHGKMIFPAGNLWNQPVDTAQVDPGSAAILGTIGLTKSLHPDFGASYNGGPFGIPYIVVPDNQPRISVPFTYADESDAGPYPIPANPPIEPGGGDSHLLMITQSEWKLYELYATVAQGTGWKAGSGAIWNLATGAPRPAGWTSADAAGLPILPGLVRYDEVYQRGEIDHALRFTVQRTRKAYLAPASHVASSSTNVLYAPMGMRVRLRASFDISGYPAGAQVILRALKKYGMMVADNGSDFYLSGTADARWNDAVNNTLKQVKVSDFEVVRMTGIVTP